MRRRIEAAEQKGFSDGCLQGWKNCENHMMAMIALAKREGAKNARQELLHQMREIEDRAYTEGLRDGGLISGNEKNYG